MDAEEARRRSKANAQRSENRAHDTRLKKDAAEHKKNKKEAKKLLPRIEKEIDAAVRKGSSSIRLPWVDEKLHEAVSSLLARNGYCCDVRRENYSDDYGLTKELEVSWRRQGQVT